MSILLDKRPDLAEPYPDPEYPESDGKPMADNTLQYEWIVTIKEGLENLLAANPDVFVAGDLLWYPVEKDSQCQAPDVMVIFGRPKGHRGSYQQSKENGIAPQVVFEILSPGNRYSEMVGKFLFYQRHDVEEYYIYDPRKKGDASFDAYRRDEDGLLTPVPDVTAYISPRLGIRFDTLGRDLIIHRADGTRFQTVQEVFAERELQRIRAEAAEAGRREVVAERDAVAAERDAVVAERDAATARAERLAALLREAGIEPD
ncbi:MAG: Uma2 family endonuclease [Armatimonadetes bacterium]|nr:Uma2 family endonuclease [Armatimonadota bacterium]